MRQAPLTNVALSGGEPLLREDLPELAADLQGLGVNVVVITNGRLITPELLDRIPRDVKFEVTLLGYRPEQHDRLAGVRAFDEVVNGLGLLASRQREFVMAFVATRENALHVRRTMELGIALGAQAMLYNRVNLARHTMAQAEQLVPPKELLAESLRQADGAAREYGFQVAVSVPIPPCIVDPSDYPSLHFGWCPRGGDEAYYTVSVDGHLRPCNHSSLRLGDLRRERFAAMTGGTAAAAFWAEEPEECRSCQHPLKDRCRGGCPAAAAECLGSGGHWDPFVPLATGQG